MILITYFYRYNTWAAERKRSGATPMVDNSPEKPWKTEEDKDLWEEEQRRLDREWYNIDEGIQNLIKIITYNQ